MPLDSPRHALRRANLIRLLSDVRIGGPTGLARLLGKPTLKGHLSNLRNGIRGLGDTLAADIEDAAELPRGWMDEQHLIAGETPPTYAIAQDLSHAMSSHSIPLVPW